MTNILAYLDPGSAGVILQMIGGGVAALAVAMKIYWRKISSILHFRSKDTEADDAVGSDKR